MRTGHRGGDATARLRDASLLPAVYLHPYLAFSPDLAFALAADDDVPFGYVVGVADTAAFADWCERYWWPRLRRGHPRSPGTGTLETSLWDRIDRPTPTSPEILGRFPAHLHIDLLPQVRGRGLGRALLERFLGELRNRDVPGVHLGVDPRNRPALGFYRRLGFMPLVPDGLLGLRL